MKKSVFLLVFFLSLTGFSQTVNDAVKLAIPGSGFGARALGMGNSYISLSDDAAGMFYNPAGIGFIRQFEFSGGLTYYNLSNSSQFFGNNTNLSNSSIRPDNMSLIFPFPTLRGSLVFGFSYHSSKDFNYTYNFDGYNPGSNSFIQDLNIDTDIPYDLYLTDTNYNTAINGRLQQSGKVLQTGSINNWAFSGAIEAGRNFFVGATLSVVSGSFSGSRDYYEDDVRGIYTGTYLSPGDAFTNGFKTFYYNSVLDWDIEGFDMKLGMLYQAGNFARLGFTVELPKSYRIKEKFFFGGRSDWNDGTTVTLDRTEISPVEYDISIPFKFGMGFAVNYLDIIFTAEASLIDYSQVKFENANGLSSAYVAGLNKVIKEDLGAVLDYNFGAEYTIPGVELKVRAGYFQRSSPYAADNSDFHKKYITAGLGYLFDNFVSVDVAYVHGFYKDFSDNYGSGVSRILHDIKTDRLIFNVSYRF